LPSWFDKLLEAPFSGFAKLYGCQEQLQQFIIPSCYCYFFLQKLKNLLQQFFISGYHLSQVGKKPPPRAHPPVFEEVEAYKNNFVFPRIPDL
jgi:hypothetical protein